MLKNLNLKIKIILYIGVVVFLSFTLTIGFVSIKAGNMADKSAKQHLSEMTHHYSGIVKAEIEVAMDAARTLAQTFEGLKKSGHMPERKVLDQIMQEILLGTQGLLAVWTCWEPNALDGLDADFVNAPGHDKTGRYIPYWSISEGKISVKPAVGYDKTGTGNFYQIPKRTGEETVIEPYLSVVGGKEVLVTSLCVPIRYNGKIVGVVGTDMALESFNKQFSKIKVYESGYLIILSNNGLYLTHPKSERLGQNIIKHSPWAEEYMGKIKSGEGFITKNYSVALKEEVGRICKPIQIGNSKKPWAVMVNVPTSEFLKEVREIKSISIAIGTIAMIILLIVIFFIVNSVTATINKGVNFAGIMATGDFSQTLDIKQNNEMGKLADSLNNMTSNLGGMIKKITSGVETLSSSSTDLAAISEQMSQGASQTSEKSGTVAAAAEEMSASTTSIAVAMEQASTNLNIIAAASEEMTSTINEVAKNTESTRTITANAVSLAKTASDKITELGDAAQEIGKVTETITDISEQTNLLALNATIEAARAGEAGKGFSVVASEIKELARLTSEATNDIRGRIDSIQQTTLISVESIQAVTKIIDDINEIVATTAVAVEEQSATTLEIAGNVAQASQGLTEINASVVQTSKVSEEITADISEVNRQSMEITGSSSNVSLNVNELLKLADNLKEMIGNFRV